MNSKNKKAQMVTKKGLNQLNQCLKIITPRERFIVPTFKKPLILVKVPNIVGIAIYSVSLSLVVAKICSFMALRMSAKINK